MFRKPGAGKRVSSGSEILFFFFVVVVVVAGGMFKKIFQVENLSPQSAGKKIYISKSAEYT